MNETRRLPVGAEIGPDGGNHFRVWAPIRKQVAVVIEDEGEFELTAEGDGFFSARMDDVEAGALYRFRLDGGPDLYPDPASPISAGRSSRAVASRRSVDLPLVGHELEGCRACRPSLV